MLINTHAQEQLSATIAAIVTKASDK